MTIATFNGASSLFPLPLVPIEMMMLHDDWPSYPMSCGAEFVFQGELDEALFERCLDLVASRHPLLHAMIRRTGKHQWSWVCAQRRPQVRWLQNSEAYEFARCEPFDLEEEIGVRIYVRRTGNESRVLFEFHHACCDGAGGLAYAEDILALYGMGCRGEALDTDELPPVDHSLLKQRDQYPQGNCRWLGRCRTSAEDIGRTLGLLVRPPAALAHRGELALPKRLSWSASRFISRRFEREDLNHLRERAASHSVTLNDLLLCKLFLAMRDWNHELGQPRNRLRVVVPVNLRNRSDLAMSAANRLSYSFLTRSERQMRSSERLLSSIGRETSTLRRNGTALELLKKLRLLQQTGRFYPWVFTPQRCFATAVFSNLGDPTRRFRIRFPRRNGLVQVGNMTLTSFAGTTALRPQTHAGFFFNTYAHQLTISTRFDPAYFTVEDANHFLERLADRLGVSSTPVVTSDRAAA